MLQVFTMLTCKHKIAETTIPRRHCFKIPDLQKGNQKNCPTFYLATQNRVNKQLPLSTRLFCEQTALYSLTE